MARTDRKDSSETQAPSGTAARSQKSQSHRAEKESKLLSGPLLMLLGAAALLTFAGAALSALAVSSEPTMRAEDSSWETTSKAVLVRRQLARSTTRPVVVDAGATSSEIYIDRSRELERSL